MNKACFFPAAAAAAIVFARNNHKELLRESHVLSLRNNEFNYNVQCNYSISGSGDAILLLVNAGAKVDAEDKDGLTGSFNFFVQEHYLTTQAKKAHTNTSTIL
jgi:hypothetical protein